MRLFSWMAVAWLIGCGDDAAAPPPKTPAAPVIEKASAEKQELYALPPTPSPPNSPTMAPEMVQVDKAPAEPSSPTITPFTDAPKCSAGVGIAKGFPEGVVGIRFGSSRAEFKALCTRAGYSTLDISTPGQPTLGCLGVTIQQAIRVDFVRAVFCKDRVCGVDLVTEQPPTQDTENDFRRLLLKARESLDSRYGPPSCGSGYARPYCSDRIVECVKTGDARAFYNWFFRGENGAVPAVTMYSSVRADIPKIEIHYSLPSRMKQEQEASKIDGM